MISQNTFFCHCCTKCCSTESERLARQELFKFIFLSFQWPFVYISLTLRRQCKAAANEYPPFPPSQPLFLCLSRRFHMCSRTSRTAAISESSTNALPTPTYYFSLTFLDVFRTSSTALMCTLSRTGPRYRQLRHLVGLDVFK